MATPSTHLELNSYQQTAPHNMLVIRQALNSQRFIDTPHAGYRELIELHQAGAKANANQYTRYARMVLETSVRRQLQALATHMEPAATTDPTEQTLRPHQGLQTILGGVADLAAQVQRSEARHTFELMTNSAAPPNVQLDIPPPPPPPLKLVERAERQLIHAIIAAQQWSHSGILERLQPDDFTASTAHATTWRAIQALHHRNEPIDPVTVAWETEILATDPRRPDEADTLSAADLSSMSTPPAADIRRAITTVTRAALAHHAQQARQQILDAATDRHIDMRQALTAAQTAEGQTSSNSPIGSPASHSRANAPTSNDYSTANERLPQQDNHQQRNQRGRGKREGPGWCRPGALLDGPRRGGVAFRPRPHYRI